MTNIKSLNHLIHSNFFKVSLVPILVIELTLVIVYFTINNFTSEKSSQILLDETEKSVVQLLNKEINILDEKLKNIKTSSQILQENNTKFFEDFDKNVVLPNGNIQFKHAKNGSFYKVNNNGGGSVWYSSKTKIGKDELKKATNSEVFDPLYKSVVDNNELIVAVYFNSYDNINRYYPFLENVYDVFGSHMVMEDYNFYYDADFKHNPKKESVWTDAYLDPAGQGWMVSCVTPIYNKDFLEGVTGIDVTLKTIFEELINLDLPYEGKSFLIGADGQVLSISKELNKYFEKHNVDIKSFSKNIEKNLTIGNKSYILHRSISKETNWQLYTLVDKDIIFAEIYEFNDFTKNIGYLAIILMIVFYIIFFAFVKVKSRKLSEEIAKPIENLAQFTKSVDANFKKNVTVQTDIEEVNTIINNFDKIVVNANTNIQEVNTLINNFDMMMVLLEKQVDEIIKKDTMLLEQSKKAEMGEMLSTIAHQLKQPLNTINIDATSIAFQREHGIDMDIDINDFSQTVIDQTKFMSETIDMFRTFFSPHKTKELSTFDQPLENIFYILSGTLYDVKVIKEYQEDLNEVFIFKNEFIQVFMNILKNAKDVLNEKDIKTKIIKIDVCEDDNFQYVTILDNAGGIEEELKEKIFEHYFTTKSEENGTGIGLYISKLIVEEKHNGKISVENDSFIYNDIKYIGAKFIIKVPLYLKEN